MSELDTTSTDAMHWAEQFVQHKKDNNWSLDDIDEGLMVGWFAGMWAAVHDPLESQLTEAQELLLIEYEKVNCLDSEIDNLKERLGELEATIAEYQAEGNQTAAEYLLDWFNSANIQGVATMDSEEVMEIASMMAPPTPSTVQETP